VVSFNLWVALPLPVAAAGMFLFLRQRLSPAASALGASVFALAGPTISMLNTPNLSWSVAFAPWVLWSVGGQRAEGGGRRSEVGGQRAEGGGRTRGARIALVYGLQALCGEPVTWAATGVIAALWSLTVASTFRRKILPIVYLALGGLLASAQLVPTFLAGVRAQRAALATPDFWSLHPLSLWEAVAPNLFGNDAWERAQIEQWNRHAELELLVPIALIFRNTHAFWHDRIKQAPEFGEIMREQVGARLAWFERELAGRQYIAGDRFTVADITALCAIDFAKISKIRLDPATQPNLSAWHERVNARPSSKA